MANKVYEIITEKIIKQLEAGEIPWKQPWLGGWPKNLISKKNYQGINTFILGCQKYSNPYWLTFKQVNQLGGKVRKGEKSTVIVFWKQLEVKEKDIDNEELVIKTIPFLRYYRVFNADQCELPEDKIPKLEVNKNFKPIEKCEKIVENMPKRPEIRHKENIAYYSPNKDYVNMPKKEYFKKEEFYYSVLFHELGHSTGHKKRLARKKFDTWSPFGSEEYSKEELVAEMTSAYLCGYCNIEQKTLENSAAYIQGWLKKLKNDKKLVILAAAQAQKAANFILNQNT